VKRASLFALWLAGGCYALAVDETGLYLRAQGELPAPVDAIVVPGCPTRLDGTPSSCNRRRVRAAARAWRDGLAPRVLFSGAAVHTKGVEAEVMAAYAMSLGVPRGAILVENRARHTTENFLYAALMLRSRGWRRVLVVTDPFQVPFALRFARRAGLAAWAQPTVAPLPAEEQRRALELDDVEPIPAVSWW
jgi:uncharacterized SAM-binding protein YcdF (DUF218 family)